MKYSLILICVLISVTSHAAEKFFGQIVFADKTVDVTLMVPIRVLGGGPNVETMQKGIKYLDAKGKKVKLKPEDAKEFRFTYEGKSYRMVSRIHTSGLQKKAMFLRQIIDGPVKMFEYSVTTNSGGPNGMTYGGTSVYELLQRGDEPLFQPVGLGFKKEAAKYFADCPDLVVLIEGKEFRRRDIEEIVTYYNEKCGRVN